MKKILCLLFLVLVLILTVVFIGCNNVKSAKVIKVGALLPLTGPASNIGTWQKNGIDLALEEINNDPSFNNKIKVIYEDSEGNPKEAVSAFQMLLRKGDIYSVFSSLSSVSNAILPIADKKKVILLMLAVSFPGIAERSKWAFRFNVGSEDEAKVLAKFLAERRGKPKMALYYLNDDFGLGAASAFKKIYKNYGGTVIWEQSYKKLQTDHRNSLLSLKSNKNVEGVYVIGYLKSTILAIKQLREINFSKPIFSNMALTVPSFIKLGGEALDGVIFTTNLFELSFQNIRVKKFVDQYKKKYGERPNFFAAFAYDATKILAFSIKKAGTYKPEFVRDALMNIRNFYGVMGKTTINRNGNVIYPVRIVVLKKGKMISIGQ